MILSIWLLVYIVNVTSKVMQCNVLSIKQTFKYHLRWFVRCVSRFSNETKPFFHTAFCYCLSLVDYSEGLRTSSNSWNISGYQWRWGDYDVGRPFCLCHYTGKLYNLQETMKNSPILRRSESCLAQPFHFTHERSWVAEIWSGFSRVPSPSRSSMT